jgi:hypothetical protein
MKKTESITSLVLCAGLLTACGDIDSRQHADLPADELEALYGEFQTPPSSAKPGVYWYFMDGIQDRDGMTADLEAMAKAGHVSTWTVGK